MHLSDYGTRLITLFIV